VFRADEVAAPRTGAGRRISADTLVGYLTPADQPAAAPAPSKPAAPAGKGGDPLLNSGGPLANLKA